MFFLIMLDFAFIGIASTLLMFIFRGIFRLKDDPYTWATFATTLIISFIYLASWVELPKIADILIGILFALGIAHYACVYIVTKWILIPKPKEQEETTNTEKPLYTLNCNHVKGFR